MGATNPLTQTVTSDRILVTGERTVPHKCQLPDCRLPFGYDTDAGTVVESQHHGEKHRNLIPRLSDEELRRIAVMVAEIVFERLMERQLLA